MTLSPVTRLDCRGMQCPEPILQTARAARKLGTGVLEILADDDAFPLDLNSWAKSTKAEIKSLEHGSDGYRAVVRVQKGRSVSSVGQASASPPVVANVPKTPTPAEEIVIDCRGLQCPQPVVQLAMRSRQMAPNTTFKVLADDDAFALDVKSWCRSSGATLVSLEGAPGQVMTATITKGAGAATAAPRAAASGTLGTAPTPALVQPPAASPSPHVASTPAIPSSVGELKLDLRALSNADALSRLQAAATLGDVAVQFVASEAFSGELMQWCGSGGHGVKGLTTDGGIVHGQLALRHTVMSAVPATQGQEDRCALLILHNDHEALLAAMLVANGAVAQGMQVVIFFSFWGLNLLRAQTPRTDMPKEPTTVPQKMFKWLMPAGPRKQKLGKHNFGGLGKGMLNKIMKDQKIMSLPELLDSASEMGAEYIACTMSMGVMGIQKRDLVDIPNLKFGGVAAFVDEASRAKINMVF